MNYKEVYEYGVHKLSEAGIDEAALDARLLLEYVCHTNRNDLLVHGDREVAEPERQSYYEIIEKRKQHIPLQHITGEQEFMGLSFEVNEHVLIPRQDTEVLVEEAMRYLHDGMDILDMCTGSGCILLSLLHYSNDCRGVGADISAQALEVAERNAVRLYKQKAQYGELGEKDILRSDCCFVQSDMFEAVEGKFDLIVSNPPYIPSDVIPTLMEEVKAHEPMSALDGKADGLFFYREIAAKAGDYLTGGGRLFFEIGHDQAEAVSHIMEQNGYKNITVVKDLAGLDRVVHGWR